MRTIVLLLILFHSLSTIAAYSRVEVDVSGLPPEKRFLASVVQSRIYDRTPPSAIADAFRIRFIIDDDIAENTCEILSNERKSEIRASTFRSLVFFRLSNNFQKVTLCEPNCNFFQHIVLVKCIVVDIWYKA